MSKLLNNLELGSAIVAMPRTTESNSVLAMDNFFQYDAVYEGKPIIVISDTEIHQQVQIDGVFYSVVKRDTILSVIERSVFEADQPKPENQA